MRLGVRISPGAISVQNCERQPPPILRLMRFDRHESARFVALKRRNQARTVLRTARKLPLAKAHVDAFDIGLVGLEGRDREEPALAGCG